ncbi:MAG: alpha/beta hydrolase [Nocardioides sp.]|nr:alpha/beta hydrolase [Nocardioides sp.]
MDWARHVHTVDIAGSSLHYLDYGDPGPDELVFVLSHGLGGRWQHWTENIPELAEHGRVIAVDLPGFGRSGPPPGRYSIDAFADAIAELVMHLNLPKVVFVGHSIGGPLAVRFAQRRPELVDAVILAAGTVQGFAAALGMQHLGSDLRTRPATVVATYFEVLTAGLPAPAFLRNQIIKRPRLRRLFLWPYLHRPEALPTESVALLVDGVGARGVLPTARAAGRLRPEQWITQVNCPMLAIGADHDAVAPLTALAEFAESVPNARTVVLEGIGHMVMLERAAAFTAEVVNFAKQPTLGP